MQQIYQFLGEPWYEHDFDNVEDSYDEFDEQAKIVGLHTVRRKVEYQARRSILPGELWDRYGPMSFWKQNFTQRQSLNWITAPQLTQSSLKKSIPLLSKQL
jgi:hypothetical protein